MHKERRSGVFGTKEAETANKLWLGIIRVYWIWITRFDFNDWTSTRNRRSREGGQATGGQGDSLVRFTDWPLQPTTELGPGIVFSYVYKSILTFSAMAKLLVSPGLSMFSKLIHP